MVGRYCEVHVYADGGVYGKSRERGLEDIGLVVKRGHDWVALSRRGDVVLFRARRKKDVVAWITSNPWGAEPC